MQPVTIADSTEVPLRRDEVNDLRSGWLLRCYVLMVVICLPMDWFEPTGVLLREFGAKPATLLLSIGGMLGLILLAPVSPSMRQIESKVAALLVLLQLLGTLAFVLNLTGGWSKFTGGGRNPLFQFLAQSLLFCMAAIAILGNARIAARYKIITLVAGAIPIAAAIHLLAWCLEAAGIINDTGVLQLFKTPGGAVDRASGLHTEPSYYGTMAAMLGVALFVIPAQGLRRTVHTLLAGALIVSAVFVTAKTFVVVAGAQGGYLMLTGRGTKYLRAFAVFFVMGVLGAMAYFAQNNAALSVEDNLSTAVRFGSTHLGVNIASRGYGLLGIGIGQYHFFFNEDFAPDYLLFSNEAIEQMQPNSEQRASAYNLYVRILDEMGLVGLLLVGYAILCVLRMKLPAPMLFLSTLFVGACGFLLTQDTYFYPPLVMACALLMAAQSEVNTDGRAVPSA